jgi:hypothetical protein
MNAITKKGESKMEISTNKFKRYGYISQNNVLQAMEGGVQVEFLNSEGLMEDARVGEGDFQHLVDAGKISEITGTCGSCGGEIVNDSCMC